MHRVFLDANVLFSAAYRTDTRLRNLWNLTGIELLTSNYAVEEARRNLGTPRRRSELENLLANVKMVADTIPDESPTLPEPGLPDKDLPIIMAAVGAGATHLLTGDFKHFGFLYGRAIENTIVLTPAVYLHSYYGRTEER